MSTSAVVFAYHDVGVRCLSVLLGAGIDVRLVVTHEDNPAERIWFDSVAALAHDHGIPAMTPADPNSSQMVRAVGELTPDFIFSFYYRHMISTALLGLARHGALNMHGSLLPHYRGRVPVNWAVIRGETQTGASLHYMTGKADAGDIVDQFAVPILPDDTALDVFRKVTCAAELVLFRALPGLITGRAQRRPQNSRLASYFGRRTPEDGRIDWRRPAEEIHNLVRGVAPPYPGAFFELGGTTVRLLRSLRAGDQGIVNGAPSLYLAGGHCFAVCGDGRVLRLLQIEIDGSPQEPVSLVPAGTASVPLI